jgi:glutamate synthase (NADPH/NADH) small chain
MGKVTGFMEFERVEEGYKPVPERVKHYKEFVIGLTNEQAKVQGARCMDCGTPFCNSGCPVNNIIPRLQRQTLGFAHRHCGHDATPK